MPTKAAKVVSSAKGIPGFHGIGMSNSVQQTTSTGNAETPLNADAITGGIEDTSVSGIPALINVSYTHINPGNGKGAIGVPNMPEGYPLVGAKIRVNV